MSELSNSAKMVSPFVSICSAATIGKRGQQNGNQDAVAATDRQGAILSAVAVADGIGSHSFSAEASKLVAADALVLLRNLEIIDALSLTALFIELRKRLQNHAKQIAGDQYDSLDRDHSFGTTLIVAVETPDKFSIAYTGNGSIWHVRGNFDHCKSNRLLPWNALNYLNPHTNEVQGREILYKYISLSEDLHKISPSIIDIQKDEIYGDMLVVCTDGIYSFDQILIGKDSQESIWISGEKSMVMLFDMLKRFARSGESGINSTNLKLALHHYLADLADKSLLEDDASIGVIVSAQAVFYNISLAQKRLNI